MQWRFLMQSGILFAMLGFWGPVNADPVFSERDVIKLSLAQIRPSQSVIAHEQVNYKLRLYQEQPAERFADLCQNAGWGKKVAFNAQSQANQPSSYQCQNAGKKKRKFAELKTVVRGPDQQYYLTDGHHAFSTFFDMPDGGPTLEVEVLLLQADVGSEMSTFWQRMQDLGYAWLYDAAGQPLPVKQMPTQLGRAHLHPDPYRAAMYFLRGSSWQKPEPALPFVEFYWAQHLRQQPQLKFPNEDTPAAYLQWLKLVQRYIAGLQPDSKIDTNFTAAALGWLGKVDAAKLDQLLCQPKPKPKQQPALAMAFEYRGFKVHCEAQ